MRTYALPLLVALLIGALLLLPSEAGQTSGPGGPPPAPPPPAPIADAVFGKVLAGEFTGDLDRDAVVMDGDTPTLLVAPDVFETSVRWSGSANDITSVLGADGNPDRLLAVGPAGLSELTWNTTTAAWDTVVHEASSWLGARRIATGNFDAASGRDLVALGDAAIDTQTVHVLHADGASGFAAPLTFQTFAPANDVLAMDWQGDGIDEIVVLTDLGVEIYGSAGDQVDYFEWTLSPILAVPIDDPAVSGQRLAMIAANAPGTVQWLLVWDDLALEGPFGLGGMGVVRMTAEDVDGDDDDDLFLSIDSAPSFVQLTTFSDVEQQDPLVPTYDLVLGSATVPFGDPARDPSTNDAGIAVADFDHDGDVDVLAPAQGDYTGGPLNNSIASQVLLLPNDETDASLEMPNLVDSHLLWDVENAPALEISFTGPAEPLVPVGGQELQLQITLWHTPDLWVPTDTTPFAEVFVDVPAVEQQDEVAINITGSTLYPWPDLYSYVIRQVILESDVVVARGPAVTGVWGSDANFENLQQQLPAIQQTIITIPVNEGGSSWPGGGVVVGPSVPRFDDDEAPR